MTRIKNIHSNLKKFGEINISENNRITYIYNEDSSGKIKEIINVSFEIRFMTDWITILRYDNHHGRMHRHKLVSLDSKIDVVNEFGVKQKGSQKKLLSWAINDIKRNYLFYKRKIISRTQTKLAKKLAVELY